MPDYNLPDPNSEKYKVLIKRGTLVDAARDNREVPIKFYYPAEYEGKKLPVIVWSHGLGGSVDGASFLSRFLAGQGYVLLHIQHRGTDSSIWEGKDGHPWDIIRKTPIPRTTTLNRFLDVPFMLDNIESWLADYPEIAEIADFSNMGMSGHSFGALTTQVVAGQMFPDVDGKLKQYPDDRFSCGILYSPVPIAHLSLDEPEDIYGSISLPLLHMTGTEDSSPVEGWDYSKRLVIHKHAAPPRQYLHVLQDGDHMIYNGSRGQLGDNPQRDEHEAEIKQVALTYWDAYLKGDEDAKGWLETL